MMIVSKIKKNIERHRLIDRNDLRPVIVGLSGGADSVALAYILSRLGYSVVAAHCNYALRGSESDGDEESVREFCKNNDITLEVLHANVSERMQIDGSSMEMACRDIRYEWFETLRCKYNAQAVAVAHHADDKIETVMLNLIRGTGIRGLASMKWRREPGIIRPMLNISRNEIRDYLRMEGVNWRDDSSNALNDVKRNKLRNIVLPHIYAEFPDAKSCIAMTSNNMEEYVRFVDNICRLKYEQYVSNDGSVDLSRLALEEPFASLLLWEWFGRDGMTRDMADKIMTFRHNSGSDYGQWYIDHGILRRSKVHSSTSPSEGMTEYDIAKLPFTLEYIDKRAFHPQRDPSVAYFDAKIIDGNPLWTLRRWQIGDRIRPFGMKGSKLVSDVFSDKKIGREAKQAANILLRNDRIVWIPGIQTSAEFAVNSSTDSILKVVFHRELL